MTTALKDLTARVAPGWTASGTAIGYYVHRGNVYLTGRIQATGAGATTSTIFTGLPLEILPASPQALQFTLDRNSKLQPPFPPYVLNDYWTAHINPDGTLVLADAIPSWINVTPTDQYWFSPSELAPTEAPDPHTYPVFSGDGPFPPSMALFIANTSWPLTPLADAPATTSIAASLDTDVTNVDAGYVAHDERVHLSGSVHAARDQATTVTDNLPSDARAGIPSGSTTTVELASGRRGAVVSAGGDVTLDSGVRPGLSLTAPFKSPTGGLPYAGRNYISGDFSRYVPVTFTAGTYSCPEQDCPDAGAMPPVTFDLAAMLAACNPTPQWCVLRFVGFGNVGAATSGCNVTDLPGLCGPQIPLARQVNTPNGHMLEPDGTVVPATPPTDGGSGNLGPGYLPPPTPLYPTAPGIPSGSYRLGPGPLAMTMPTWDKSVLWRADQVTGTLDVTLDGTYHSIDSSAWLLLIPIYELDSSDLIHSGDTIDLSVTGWEGVTVPPTPLLPPGFVNVHPGPQAIFRLGRRQLLGG